MRAARGAIRLRDLQPTRTQRRRIADLVAHRQLYIDHGVVFLPGAPRELVLARRYAGLVTCGAGARAYGLPVPSWVRAPLHLCVPHGRYDPCGVVVHTDRRLSRPALQSPPYPPVAELLARYLCCDREPEVPLAAVDAALRRGIVTRQQILDCLHGRTGAPEARRRLAMASARARSPLETAARVDLHEAGLSYRDGVVIPRVGEVDFLVEGLVVVETDGREFHDDLYSFEHDRRRDRALAALGLVTLRFTYDDVRSHRVVPDVRAVLARHGRVPAQGVTIDANRLRSV
ncbi:endonuclease domain-containing protein [Actinomyces faecalis]|uniref:endonuclease domain-containing protein n=1 Tax=Actinomyces faecalis TaxID=2722820 RepID=UPI001FD18051|nr:DUF559 domain-containing protein [Actinomyces faecalis]